MEYRFIDVSESIPVPVPRVVTLEEESDIMSQYRSSQTVEQLAASYFDLDKQVAAGMSAEQMLNELQEDSQP